MAENIVRFVRNGNIIAEQHVPPDADVKVSKDGDITTVNLFFATDDMPGPNTANSELEAQIPVPHALTVSDVKELDSPVKHDMKAPKPLSPKEAAKLVEDDTAERGEAAAAPAEAQKEKLQAEGRDPDQSDATNRAAQRRKAAASRKASSK
jgi:hypothetical protein